MDWNDQKYCEIWRHEWEVIQNRYLEANDRPERVDLRSYARQGLDIVPTVHEGAAVRQMEKRGIQTNIGNLNREIRAANRLMKSIRQLIQTSKAGLPSWVKTERAACTKSGGGSNASSQSADEVYGDTKGRTEGLDKGWTKPGNFTGLKGSQRSPVLSPAKGLSTVEDLEAFLESSGKSAADYRNQMKPKEARSKVIDGILASRTDCKECEPVYEKYQKIFLRKQRRNSNRNTRRSPGMRKPPPTLPSTRTIRTAPKRS